MLTRKVSILVSLMLLFNLNSFSAISYNKSYESLDELSDEVLFLGDIVTIDADWCWPNKKPTQATAKKRLEIYKSDKWRSVGRTIFTKSNLCKKKTPYLQQFQWEVDEMGVMDTNGISGKLRVRNSAVKPTIYSQAVIYESEFAYQSKLRADEEKAKKEAEEKLLDAYFIFECFVKGGQWNSQGKYCVLPKG
jgi:hypothetical protein